MIAFLTNPWVWGPLGLTTVYAGYRWLRRTPAESVEPSKEAIGLSYLTPTLWKREPEGVSSYASWVSDYAGESVVKPTTPLRDAPTTDPITGPINGLTKPNPGPARTPIPSYTYAQYQPRPATTGPITPSLRPEYLR